MESQTIRPGHLTAHQTAQRLGITPAGGWPPIAAHLHREVPRGF
ncbi:MULTISPECIES: hypothetical protein [unclassified Streptomyces]|uniref:Uncharacterized protein n=1 Tax=Streptomyces sp. NBC_00180 TaxID=2903632 RepID=A0AAU1I1N8_9ACTN|nr:hypothetical protein OG331_31495 [Streptomyces sp. NBC_01017]